MNLPYVDQRSTVITSHFTPINFTNFVIPSCITHHIHSPHATTLGTMLSLSLAGSFQAYMHLDYFPSRFSQRHAVHAWTREFTKDFSLATWPQEIGKFWTQDIQVYESALSNTIAAILQRDQHPPHFTRRETSQAQVWRTVFQKNQTTTVDSFLPLSKMYLQLQGNKLLEKERAQNIHLSNYRKGRVSECAGHTSARFLSRLSLFCTPTLGIQYPHEKKHRLFVDIHFSLYYRTLSDVSWRLNIRS